MRQCASAAPSKPGCINANVYMAGTISVCVTRSAASVARKSAALNCGSTTMAPPTCTIAAMMAISPVTWLPGTARAERSPGRRPMQTS